MRIIWNLILCVVLISCSSSSENDKTLPDGDTTDEVPSPKDKEEGFYNPVFEPVLADPSVVFDSSDNTFYAYGTEDDWDDGKGGRYIPILRSTTLTDWEYVGNAFSRKPSWKSDGGLWAPDINKIDGKYLMYYAYSTWGDENPGIGLAISDRPEGPFTDQGKLFDSKEIEVPNSIDPFLYRDGSKKYLFWGSYSNDAHQGTYLIELTDDGRKIKKGAEKIKIAAGDFEAVMMYKRDNYYYFFGSKGSCCEGAESTYHVLVARSENLFGPYVDKEGQEIVERGNGTLILEGNNKYKGPGHVSNIVKDKNGTEWIFYHAIDSQHGKLSNGTSRRMLMLDKINWEGNWPVIADKTPSIFSKTSPKF